jgi:hypothetical protein
MVIAIATDDDDEGRRETFSDDDDDAAAAAIISVLIPSLTSAVYKSRASNRDILESKALYK